MHKKPCKQYQQEKIPKDFFFNHEGINKTDTLKKLKFTITVHRYFLEVGEGVGGGWRALEVQAVTVTVLSHLLSANLPLLFTDLLSVKLQPKCITFFIT